jgi:glucokinase
MTVQTHSRLIVSIDIGGTNLRGALIDPSLDTTRIRRIKERTKALEGRDILLQQLLDMIRALVSRSDHKEVAGVSISLPGLIDSEMGVVKLAYNLPVWNHFPLAEFVKRETGLATILLNDANAGAFAEWKHVLQCKIDNLVYVTVSTGIGAGLILNGQLYLSSTGDAGELGHVPVSLHGPRCHECGCGRGCLTAYASGPAIVNYVRSQLRRQGGVLLEMARGDPKCIEPAMILRAAKLGDPLAQHAYRRAGEALGQAILGICRLLNPSVIAIGGGVTKSGNFLLLPAREMMLARGINNARMRLKVAGLGDNQCLIGASCYAVSCWKL